MSNSIEKQYQKRLNMINEMKRNGVSQSTVQREMADARIEYNNARVKAGLMSEGDAKRANAEIIKQKGINDTQRMRRAGVSDVTINAVQEQNNQEYQTALGKQSELRN